MEINDIYKIYRVIRRESGLGSAVKSLFKREYNTINAINHINFSIHSSEMAGYIGPNGAGKSSTIKILSGVFVDNYLFLNHAKSSVIIPSNSF